MTRAGNVESERSAEVTRDGRSAHEKDDCNGVRLEVVARASGVRYNFLIQIASKMWLVA